jgi:electron transport complex protein RnfC
MQLMPLYLKEAAKAEDYDKLKQLDINNCIECGSCSFVCPGANNPAQSIKVAKMKLRNKK